MAEFTKLLVSNYNMQSNQQLQLHCTTSGNKMVLMHSTLY